MINIGDIVYLREETILNLLRHNSNRLCRKDVIKGKITDIIGSIYLVLLDDKIHKYQGSIEDFVSIREMRMQKIKNLYD